MAPRLWIFGYGSLTWKVDFPYEQRVVGYIKGYTRRFWQASIDHRGVPDKPGRVVTLIRSEDPEDQVWGAAYEIAPENETSVLIHLDYREKDGYSRVPVQFHPQSDTLMPWELMIYLGSENNPFFTGPSTEDHIAKVISSAVGPSGSNYEYVCKLADSMRSIGVEDSHIFSIEAKVKHIFE